MKIEERLRSSEIGSTNSALLWAQWRFDRELVARSLNVISTVFPHYSLHESSHSISIILEIEKILGANIDKLSFVDSWLLLESAYWHDIGMIVTHEEKKEIIESPEFLNFLQQLTCQSNDFTEYATIYVDYLNGIKTSNIIDLERAFTFLLAEYVRRSHPERSKHVLKNPESIGIKSPQTGLINSRLFVLLGEILETHGQPFESILKLPFENDGLEAGDIAHPRLIASLLRIGDLLDLDDGRHCPTQLKSIGKLPALSMAHLEKHRSIVSKNINELHIEIRAKCTSYESFEVQNDWFSYIETEIENQDKYWGEIAPKSNFWKLPNLKALTCDLAGSISLGTKSSRLSLDTSRIYDFLNGRYIYENPLACILELLQNAVDATIDRIWLEKKDVIRSIDTFRSIASNFKITVGVTQTHISDGKVEYKVVISDTGKGMTLEDIKAILIIASESSQKRKEILRSGMPNWMRPSGFFGIGLQSVFSLSEQLDIQTRSASDSLYRIKIKSTKGKTPSFVIQKQETNDWNFGTSVSFTIIDDAIPGSISGRKAVFNTLSRFDPLKDSVLNAKESQIEEQVAEFARFCEFEVEFNGTKLENNRNQFQIVDIENGIEYVLEFVLQSRVSDWSFRGRPFKTSSRYKYINIKGNIISERADSFLPLNREKIHQSGQDLLDDKVAKSLLRMQSDIILVIKNKEIASLYYYLNGSEFDKSWKDIKLSGCKLSSLIEVGQHIEVSFDHSNEKIISQPFAGKTVISNDYDGASILIDVIHKLNYGVIIHQINFADAKNLHTEGTHKITIYSIEILGNPSLSRIEPNAVSFLSCQKLSKNRVRHWLPCGENQFTDISISSTSDYSWVFQLTPFAQFFPKGIILRSTYRTLEEDMITLVGAIKKIKPGVSEGKIEESLREFYKEYLFESKDDEYPLF
jgi:hypothetical protein